VKHLAADMAVYHLYSRRGMMQEILREKYQDAVKFLKDVAAVDVEEFTG
jgi:phage gp36-like protein